MESSAPRPSGAVIERLSYIVARSAEGLDCSEVLSRTYCEFRPGKSPAQGRLMARAVLDTAERFAAWSSLAEEDPRAFASEYAHTLCPGSPPRERGEALYRFSGLLPLVSSGAAPGAPAAGGDLPGLEQHALEALLSLPEPELPAAEAADAAAAASLRRRSGCVPRCAWEALALYTAACSEGGDDMPTLEQYTAAVCAQQSALKTACFIRRLTSAQARRRLRAAQLVGSAMLCAAAASALAFNALFAGSLSVAGSACRRALTQSAAQTAPFNRAAAEMLEALSAEALPLELDPERAAIPRPHASIARPSPETDTLEDTQGDADEDTDRLRDDF